MTHPIVHPKEIVCHCARALYILVDYGLQIHNTEMELWYSPNDSLKAKKLLRDFAPDKIKIAVGINAQLKVRKYPVEKYLVALKEIISKGAAIIILGGYDEQSDAKFLQNNLPSDCVLNLTEILPGRRVEAAILSEQVDMYLGNMTGTADMAAAAHIPCILTQPIHEPFAEKLFGLSLTVSCFTWQTNAIFVKPKSFDIQLENKSLREIWKLSEMSNAIEQIEPEEIISAYDEMIHFMKYSNIKKVKCPPIIKNINAIKNLSGIFD